MRRREFITLIGGAATAWPLAARAQQQATPVIGFLHSGSLGGTRNLLIALRKGLAEFGYMDGQNVAIEYRWAEGHFDRLPPLAAELIQRGAAIIITGGIGSALGARTASETVPLVFLAAEDPVKYGLVASLNRPGGTATGLAWFTSELFAKRLELLRELVPAASMIGALTNPRRRWVMMRSVAFCIDRCRHRMARQWSPFTCARVVLVKMTSGLSLTNSFASTGRRFKSPAAYRRSRSMSRPST